MPPSNILDNHSTGKAGDHLDSILTKGAELSIVSAYFTIQAYGHLKEKLHEIQRLRFLFGEPSFLSEVEEEQKPPKEFCLTERGIELSNQLSQKKLAKDCSEWIQEKVEIRSMKRSGFMHGKMYHSKQSNKDDALVGSSNFTASGLGIGSGKGNVELNLAVRERKDRKDLLSWFDQWWENKEETEDVKKQVLRELKRLHTNNDPDFIYYLTLFHIFRDFLDDTRHASDSLKDIELPDTEIWKALYGFQKDGTKSAINMIMNHGGCILADSVGLGKTFTALAVIKFFELMNERVLVLCPKRLRRNWAVYKSNDRLNPFIEDRFMYDVLSHTDLSRKNGYAGDINLGTFNWSNYHLVVIDESHNFRNNSRPDEEGKKVTRYQKLINDVIGKGMKTKVLLLSATPVNNRLSDLRNQISLIAGGDVSIDQKADGVFSKSFGISSVKGTTKAAQNRFTEWSKKKRGERDEKNLVEAMGSDFFSLLDGLTIARSRRHIEKYYAGEMKKLGKFPKRNAPDSIHSDIDLKDNQLSFESLNKEIDNLTLAIYHPTAYLRDDLDKDQKEKYMDKIMNGFTQEGRERILVSLMKVNFLKRLESSVDSFRETLKRTVQKINDLEEKIDKFTAWEFEYSDIVLGNDDDLDSEEFMIGGKRRFHLSHINTEAWKRQFHKDRKILQDIIEKTDLVTPERDAKLDHLRHIMKNKLSKKRNRKILIFTAFSDTASYLYNNLKEYSRSTARHIAMVCGGDRNHTSLGKNNYEDILTNFSPLSKKRSQKSDPDHKDEIDVLIATDCISEGQNLQDCDLVINYDIHWNPVRIIQRFGRIDRIGSKNKTISMVNFWPVKDLDRYLKLKHRVEARMALVDLSATQSDNLLKDEQLKEFIEQELSFRDQQLRKIKEEVFSLEDFGNESVNLTDFSLDEFSY